MALCLAIQDVDAKNVNGEVITSAPFSKPKIWEAITKASVPDATPIACFAPVYSFIASSKFLTCGPSIKLPLSTTSNIALSNSAFFLNILF